MKKGRVGARVGRGAKGAVALLLGMGMVPLAGAQEAFPPPAPTYPTAPGPVGVINPAPLELRVRRVKDAVEVVIENTGTAPQLEQSASGGSWLGRLYTSRPSALLRGPQAVAVPDAGFERISIEGGGTVYNLRVTPVPGYPVRPPIVSADGRNVVLSFAAPVMPSQQTLRRNTLAPGAVANPLFAPPLRQRASAPPVGDMAVGTMVLKDPSSLNELNVSGPPVTLTFKNVPALNALQALARIGGYGFMANSSNTITQTKEREKGNTSEGVVQREKMTTETKLASPPVTATFVREDYRTALNMILTSSGLFGKLTPNGRTIVVGDSADACGFGGRRVISKVYRLNQANPESAAQYLASLGLFVRMPVRFERSVSIGASSTSGGGSGGGGADLGGGSGGSEVSRNITSTITQGEQIKAFGGQVGPLQGLCGTIDRRLGSITLVGHPNLVSIAEQYIRQIDLRQRQVALSIKILDVSLGNDKTIDNSFAFRYGNNFIVNQQGQLLANFGGLKPPNSAEAGLPGLYNGFTGSPIVGAGGFRLPGPGGEGSFFLTPNSNNNIPSPGTTPFYNPNYPARPGFGSYANPGQPGVTEFTPGTPEKETTSIVNGNIVINREPGTPDTRTWATPTAFQYPPNQFFDFVRAVIESRSTKILASPTLILSEESTYIGGGDGGQQTGGLSRTSTGIISRIGRDRSNESAVLVGEEVITSFAVQAGQNGAPNTCQPELDIAGLVFGAKVSKIDDNGFVTFSLSPRISGAIRRERVEGCGFIEVLSIRALETGSARVRDGQTLILTGVISDRDIEQVSKWPILGDMPLIGQFFRTSGGNRERRELVVMVTPRIINDTEGGAYGYGYEPSTREMRQFMTPSLSTPMPSALPQ